MDFEMENEVPIISFDTVTYLSILKLEPTFVSLDISVNSTGWVRSKEGVIEYGTNCLSAKDELGRRREFREFLKTLLGGYHWPVVFVEDVIGGTNFMTTKGLIQLNSIVDDLAADEIVDVEKIKRIDNNQWKKYLRKVSGYVPKILKEDPKVSIRNSLHMLGFCENVKQDIYDAMGIVIGTTFRDKMCGKERNEVKALKMDLRRGFDIKGYITEGDANLACKKQQKKWVDRPIIKLDWKNESRDVLYLFKHMIKVENRDDGIYLIAIKSMKLGLLALTKNLDTDREDVYLVITRKK